MGVPGMVGINPQVIATSDAEAVSDKLKFSLNVSHHRLFNVFLHYHVSERAF